MNEYEVVLQEAAEKGYKVFENLHFESDAKGLINGHNIGLSVSLETTAEKCCILAEELAHAEVSRSNIIDQTTWKGRHEEMIARRRSYDKLIGIDGLLDAFEAGCQSRYEAAEFLGVTEEFLQAAVNGYIEKYGYYLRRGDYLITLAPIGVYKVYESP